jgi:putative pyruvate formate lyase activating enzyme
VAWAGLHHGEEPSLIGEKGSGTIFFSGCTLKCSYCQNCQLSNQGLGREIPSEELQRVMQQLQKSNAPNINLVTAGHFLPSIVESIAQARANGLRIPTVWNSAGYENLATLDLLKDTIDVYLPDCKTLDREVSRRLMGAPDYPAVVRPALLKMVEDKPLIFEQKQFRQGVIVRHLVLPGLIDQSRKVLKWFAEHMKDRALLSLMFQYTPVRSAGDMGSPQRIVNQREYDQVLCWLGELGIDDGFVQDPVKNDDWLPDFGRINPFPQDQAVPIWHYKYGLLE